MVALFTYTGIWKPEFQKYEGFFVTARGIYPQNCSDNRRFMLIEQAGQGRNLAYRIWPKNKQTKGSF
jgi:hypothetical protein